MPLAQNDLLTARRFLRALQHGLVLEEALDLVEGALDGFPDCEDLLGYALGQALKGTPVCVVRQAHPAHGKEDVNHGQ